MRAPASFRGRIFLVLLLVALIPAALLLTLGTAGLHEVVEATGTAGAWDRIGRSGQELLDEVAGVQEPSAGLRAAAAQHRGELAESVRFSRVYGFLAQRLLSLVPALAVGLLVLIGVLALLAANWFSADLSSPVEELVNLTRVLGTGGPLPPSDPEHARREIREFAVLKNALRGTADRLEEARVREADRIRTQSWAEMARGVAHELKNPLTPMRMAAERVARSQDPAIAEAGEVLREEILRLDVLARTFAQLGRPVEGPPAPVDLTELVSSLARKLSTEQVPIALDAPDHVVEVRGHIVPLERVVRNLLANAQEAVIEGAGAGGCLAVELVLRTLDTGAEIRVLDRGPGIPAHLLERIWQPEFTSKKRGTGLGLPLVRQAVLAHGGEVWAANRVGGGSEFGIRLPFDPPDVPSLLSDLPAPGEPAT